MKDIAAYTESLHAWPRHVEYAAAFAATLGAQLTGIYVCPSPEMGLPAYDVPGFVQEWADQVRELVDEACKAESGFVAEARQRHLEQAVWQVAQGYVPDCLAMASNWHDLLVLGSDAAALWGSPSAIGDIMLSCDIPCLIVPAAYGKPFSLDCVAIAWNGSMTSLRAIHAALPILARARHIAVLESADPASPTAAWKPRFDLTRYLRRHGLAPQASTVARHGKGIGSDLLQAANRAGADLLVMGGYGHTRLRERVLGGATKEVLEQASLPVWMRH